MLPRFAVIGNPIAHSRSPEIHALFSAQTGIALEYGRELVPRDGFAACVSALQARNYRGANVTLPFKEDALRLATRLTDRAKRAGAVNTLSFSGTGILGDNTDGEGLVRDLLQNLSVKLTGRRVLLLGAGGAARGVLHPLLDAGPQALVIANRTLARAEALAATDDQPGRTRAARFDALAGVFDLVVNATSASVTGDVPAVPRSCFAPHTLAYDMMYGATPTAFVAYAAASGARTADGLGMLVEQAAAAFHVWHGVRPETPPVMAALRARLTP